MLKKTARSLIALSRFNDDPGISMGSDVFGAIRLAINNMKRASEQVPKRLYKQSQLRQT